MENLEEIAGTLKQIRQTSGKSQAEFAKMIGVSQRTWSAYETGETRPKLALLIALESRGYLVPGLTSPGFLTDMVGKGQLASIEEGELKHIVRQAAAIYAPPDMPFDDPDFKEKIAPFDGRIEKLLQNIKVPQTAGTYKIPLLRQKVSCGPGENWENEENIEEYLALDALIPRLSVSRIFAIKAHGSSMLGAGIRGGDYVLFDADENQAVRDGIYIFALDGELYCKRLEFDGLAQTVKIFSVRSAELEKAELLKTLNIGDVDFIDRFRIFGRVSCWLHPNPQEE